MKEKTRQHHEPLRPDAGAEPAGGGEDAAAEGAAFLTAGQNAIQKALSTNSADFLAATKQHGGQ